MVTKVIFFSSLIFFNLAHLMEVNKNFVCLCEESDCLCVYSQRTLKYFNFYFLFLLLRAFLSCIWFMLPLSHYISTKATCLAERLYVWWMRRWFRVALDALIFRLSVDEHNSVVDSAEIDLNRPKFLRFSRCLPRH